MREGKGSVLTDEAGTRAVGFRGLVLWLGLVAHPYAVLTARRVGALPTSGEEIAALTG